MIGFMGNNLLPAHLGEFARVFVLGHESKLPKTAVFSSVLLERVFDTASILGFFGVSLLLVELPQTYKIASLYMAGLTTVGFLVFAVYVFLDRSVRAGGGVGVESFTILARNPSRNADRDARIRGRRTCLPAKREAHFLDPDHLCTTVVSDGSHGAHRPMELRIAPAAARLFDCYGCDGVWGSDSLDTRVFRGSPVLFLD